MLASVLCQQPEILLLDEPTTGLDLHHQVSFFELLAGLAKDGLAVAVVTHDLNLAAMFCNKILLMNQGRIVKFDNVKNVLNEKVLDSVYPKNVVVDKHPAMPNIPIILPFTKSNQE
jgi:iron complex transport system ATP-binding protein